MVRRRLVEAVGRAATVDRAVVAAVPAVAVVAKAPNKG